METYLTIAGLADHLKLSAQTIRRYVLNGEVPYHKIKKVIRFRLSEIEKWVDGGGRGGLITSDDDLEGDLFADVEAGEDTGETAGTDEDGAEVENEGAQK
jgi:excisionase family DNA binding protein